jgi:hypothetical protein
MAVKGWPSSPADAAADDGADALVLRPRQELAHHLSGLLHGRQPLLQTPGPASALRKYEDDAFAS